MKPLLIILLTNFFTGCTLHSAHYADMDPVETKKPEEEQRRSLMYIGNALLDADERAELFSETRRYDYQKYKSFYEGLDQFYSDYDRNQELLKFLGDDNFSTNALLATGFIYAADGLFELFTADGDSDYVSHFYLPPSIDSISLDSAEDARQYAKKYLKSRLSLWSKLVGRKVECYKYCDSYAPTFRIYKEGAEIGDYYDHEKEYEFQKSPAYDPPNIYVSYYIRPLVEAPIDPTRDRILGFAAKWMSKSINGAPVIWGQIKPDENGNVVFSDLDHEAKWPSIFMYGNARPTIYMDMLRHLSGEEGYYFIGRDKLLEQFISYKMKYYDVCSICDGDRMVFSRILVEKSEKLIRER